MSNTVTNEELLADLRAFATTLGRVPTTQEMTEQGPHSHTIYYSRFDSWSQALNRAGLTATTQNRISTDDLLTELRTLTDTLGHPPTIAEMNDKGTFAVSTYIRRFGSWLDARAAAELDETETHPTAKLTTKQLLAEIRRLADELDRTPTTVDMDERGEYGLRTYYTRFDSWREAIEAADLREDTN